MRVIIVNDFAYVNGGASQIALLTAKYLAKNSVSTCLFAGAGPVEESLNCIENLKVVCLNEKDILNDTNRFRASIKGLWNFHAGNEFRKLLLSYDNKETVVHIQTCQKVLSSSCVYWAKRLGFKVIYHLHDFGLACPNLGFYNYKTSKICKVKAMSRLCCKTDCDSRKYVHKIWRLVRQFVQNKIGGIPFSVDGFIAVSAFSKEILKPYLPLNKVLRVIANPMEQQEESSIVNVINNKHLLFIGRLSPEKNPVLAAQCAKELNLPIIFIGKGICEEEIRKEYPQAILAGWIEKKEMYQYIKKARLLILSSAWYETQGLVVSEVAAYGIPSIVPETCAATDYIKNGINGLVFKNNDKESLMEKITLSLDDLFWEKISKNSLEIYKKKIVSTEQYIKIIKQFYTTILLDNPNEKNKVF